MITSTRDVLLAPCGRTLQLVVLLAMSAAALTTAPARALGADDESTASPSDTAGESATADAPAAANDGRAVIHFVDLGGIASWRPDGAGAILIEGRNRRWYRATFYGLCPSLRFANTIGFVTDATGDLDRFSSVLVDGERCWLRSLDRIAKPASPAAG